MALSTDDPQPQPPQPRQPTVGFVGLGNIGGGAAANLARAGYAVQVFDLDAAKIASIVALGAAPADSPASAASGADVVFTSLPGPAQIRSVALDAGMLDAIAADAVWVDLSTNNLATANTLGEYASNRGVHVIDAPVSGGPEGAQAGTLSIFVGGDDAPVRRVWPLLQIIGARVDHLGAPGAGVVAKIAQVTLCYTQTVTLIEALILGVKGGIDPAKMLDLIQHSAGASYVADTYGPEILAGTYDASFPISHAAKDMRLASELAAMIGAQLPFMDEVAALYAETEAAYGPTAPHLLAAQMIEHNNAISLHEIASEPTSRENPS